MSTEKKNRHSKKKERKQSIERTTPRVTFNSNVFNNRLSLLNAALSSFLPQSPKVAQHDLASRFSLLDSSSLQLFKKQRRFLVDQYFGVQTPTIRLNLVFGSVTINSGIIGLSYLIASSNLHQISSWQVLFDEVMPISGAMYFQSAYQQSLGVGKLILTGCIDYESGTIPATSSDMMAYDSVKIFEACLMESCIVKWPLVFHLPDKEFFPVGSSDPWAYLLLNNYNAPTITSLTEIGIVYGKLRLVFRQVE